MSMLKSFLTLLAFSAFLLSNVYAHDILEIVSKGELTSNSIGIKELSLEEKKQIKGGYIINFTTRGNEMWAYADYGQKEISYVANHYVASIYGENNPNISTFRGLCGIDTQTCGNPSQRRMAEFLNVTNGDYFDFRPAYIVTRNIGFSKTGKFVYFTYRTGVVDVTRGQTYKFDATTSSSHVNRNMIIKEIANKYKSSMESQLGGWFVR